jgi:hypothetical protein
MTDGTGSLPPEQPTTHTQIPPQPTAPPPPLPPQAEPRYEPGTIDAGSPRPTRNSRVPWVIGGVSVLVLLLSFGGFGVLLANTNGRGKPASSAAPTSQSTTSAPTTAAAPTTAPASIAPAVATYDNPTERDFKLKVKILRKQCFGSAGCNITYRIEVTYTGAGLDPSKTYEVTYEVKGAEDPIVNTLEVTGDSASVQQEESAGTKRSTDKLTAVATSVSEL